MKKKFACMLAVCLAMNLFPVATFAVDVATRQTTQNDVLAEVENEDEKEAEVNGSKHSTLPEAIEAAAPGAKIKLLKDVHLTEKLVINKDITKM